VTGGEEQAGSQGFLVRLLHGQGFAELGTRLASRADLGAGLQGQAAVAGGVAKHFGADPVDLLAAIAAGHDLGDAIVLLAGRVDGGVQQEDDVRFADDLVVKQKVPEFPGPLGVAHGVGEAEFFEDAALAPAWVSRVGAHDVHANFRGGIAAQARAVLDQNDAGAVASRGDGGADAREAAAGDDEIGLQFDEAHVGFRGQLARAQRRGRHRVHATADVLNRGRLVLGRRDSIGQDDQRIAGEGESLEKVTARHPAYYAAFGGARANR
jgi:hypothetical protein